MALVNRKAFNSTLRPDIYELFDKLSKETRIPKTKLTDEAITDLLKKYSYEVKE